MQLSYLQRCPNPQKPQIGYIKMARKNKVAGVTKLANQLTLK